MSAAGSSQVAVDLYGIPLGSGLTNGAGVLTPGNIVTVAGARSNPIILTRIVHEGYYKFILTGYANGVAVGLTGITLFLYSDLAATVQIGSITVPCIPGAAVVGGTYPFNVQQTIFLPRSILPVPPLNVMLNGLTARIVVSGNASTLYNTMPNPATSQGLAIYWQPLSVPDRLR